VEEQVLLAGYFANSLQNGIAVDTQGLNARHVIPFPEKVIDFRDNISSPRHLNFLLRPEEGR
jgi:hypothetical protein